MHLMSLPLKCTVCFSFRPSKGQIKEKLLNKNFILDFDYLQLQNIRVIDLFFAYIQT